MSIFVNLEWLANFWPEIPSDDVLARYIPYPDNEEEVRAFARKVVLPNFLRRGKGTQIKFSNTLRYAIHAAPEGDLYEALHDITLKGSYGTFDVRRFYWLVWDELFDGEDYRIAPDMEVYFSETAVLLVNGIANEQKRIEKLEIGEPYPIQATLKKNAEPLLFFTPPENIDTLSNAAILAIVQQISWEQAAGYAAARLSMLDAVPEDMSDDDLSQQHNDYILLILYKIGAKRAIIYFERFIEALIEQLAWDAEKACDTFIFALNKAYWQRSEYNDFPNSLDSYLEMAFDAIHDERADVKNVVYLFSMKYVDGEYIIDDACV